MAKLRIVTLVAALSIVPAVASAANMHTAQGNRAVAVQSAPQLSLEAAQLVQRNSESASLICLGSLFVGAAFLFSARRTNV